MATSGGRSAERRFPRRLLALNQCGRYYLLALTVQVRCLVLEGSPEMARACIGDEERTMAELADVMFRAVLGRHPQVYLDPQFQADQVTLEALTEVYQQARQAGVETGVEAAGPAGLFEHLRPRIGRTGLTRLPWPASSPRARKAAYLAGLKYLLACLEEVNRVLGLRLRIDDAVEGNYSLQELEQQVAQLREQAAAGWREPGDADVLAYAFT